MEKKFSDFGNFILLRHNQRHYNRSTNQWAYVYSIYLHLSQNSVSVNVGDTVNSGQLIAQSDNTGKFSSGPHFHYQIVINTSANLTLEPNTLESESRTRNPELWLTPFNYNGSNTARVIGKLTDTNGNPIGGKYIVGIQKPSSAGGTCGSGGSFGNVKTYDQTWQNPDDILVENFATTDIQPGIYHLYAYNSYDTLTCTPSGLFRDLGNYTFAAGQTTYVGLYPVYLSDIRSQAGWQSSITIRNISGANIAQVVTTYFYASGTVADQRTDYLQPNQSLTFSSPTLLGEGSAVIASSQDVAVVVSQERSNLYTHEAYAGVDKPTSTVWVPIVQRNNSGIYSDLFIQNTGNTNTTINLEFFGAVGGCILTSCPFSNQATLSPGTRARLLTSNYSIGDGFYGSVQITNSANQPLAVASTQYKEVYDSNAVLTLSQLFETSNTQPPATTLYAPLVQNNNNGIYSGLALRRTGGGNFDVRYYRPNADPTPTAECTNQIDLAGNPLILFPAPPAGNPCPTILAAKLDADSTMVANINQLKTGGQATTYAAISTPKQTAIVAKVRRGNGWNDGFVIANFNTVAVNVTVSLYNADGSFNSTPVNNQSLGVNRNLVVFGQLPILFIGSAVITANQPIVVSANSLYTGAGDILGSYPATQR